jgi:hypothetical protein
MQCACGKIVCIVNKNREIEKLFDLLSEKKQHFNQSHRKELLDRFVKVAIIFYLCVSIYRNNECCAHFFPGK